MNPEPEDEYLIIPCHWCRVLHVPPMIVEHTCVCHEGNLPVVLPTNVKIIPDFFTDEVLQLRPFCRYWQTQVDFPAHWLPEYLNCGITWTLMMSWS